MTKKLVPDIFAEICMFSKDDGGAEKTKLDGWRAPCFRLNNTNVGGYTGLFFIDDNGLKAGDIKRVGVKFLNREDALNEFNKSGVFYVWEGRFIASANILKA